MLHILRVVNDLYIWSWGKKRVLLKGKNRVVDYLLLCGMHATCETTLFLPFNNALFTLVPYNMSMMTMTTVVVVVVVVWSGL